MDELQTNHVWSRKNLMIRTHPCYTSKFLYNLYFSTFEFEQEIPLTWQRLSSDFLFEFLNNL